MKRLSGIALVLLVCGFAAWPGVGDAKMLGHYGFTFSGSVIRSAGFNGPMVGEGDFQTDGHGNVTGSETFNVTGTVCSGSFGGTYTVDQDGAGTLTADFTPSIRGCPSGRFHLSFNMVDNDEKIYFVQTDPQKVVSGIAEKK